MSPTTHQRIVPMTEIPSSSHPLNTNEWQNLKPGDEVSIERAGEFPCTGHIDDITKDAGIFWIRFHNGGGRILVHRDDAVTVRRVPATLDQRWQLE